MAKALEVNLLIFSTATVPQAQSVPTYRAPPLENAGPEIFLWAHKVKDGEGHESPHYVPLLPQSAMPAQGGGGQTSLRRFILPVRFGQDLHKKGINLEIKLHVRSRWASEKTP